MSNGFADTHLLHKNLGYDEEWQRPSFSGDFYAEPDSVFRGITLTSADMPSGVLLSPVVVPDFYCHQNDNGKDRHHLAETSFQELPNCSSNLLVQDVDFSELRFTENDFPPNAPADSFFKFDATTLFVTSSTPFEIGNHLLDFFTHQVTSMITKLNRNKFCIKADVFVEGTMCSIKARVYNHALGQFAVEFQRRGGDTLCFINTFQQAFAYSQVVLNMTACPLEQLPILVNFESPTPPQEHAEEMVETDLAPLVDMAELKMPGLQAEVASSLLKMASSDEPRSLCTPCVFRASGALMKADSMDAAYPTACLVARLAELMEAAPLFASLLPLMLDKVRSPKTHMQVRRRLAQALSAAIQRQSEATLSPFQSAELLRAFSDMRLKEVCCGNLSHEVSQNLQTAHEVLRGKFEAAQGEQQQST